MIDSRAAVGSTERRRDTGQYVYEYMRGLSTMFFASSSRMRAEHLSMTATTRRPFYTEYAWAFDLLIDRPVRKECAVIASWLVDRGVLPGAPLLDPAVAPASFDVVSHWEATMINDIRLARESNRRYRRFTGKSSVARSTTTPLLTTAAIRLA